MKKPQPFKPSKEMLARRDEAERAKQHSEAIRQRSIAARIESERVRAAYAKAGSRLVR